MGGTGNYRVSDRRCLLGVVRLTHVANRNPNPPVGVVVRVFLCSGSLGRCKRVHNVQREREDGILRSVIAVDNLLYVEAGTTLVGCGKRGGRFINVVRCAVEGIDVRFGCSLGNRIVCVRLDEHDHIGADKHRVDGLGVDFPLKGFALDFRLGEGIVTAFGSGKRLAIRAHDANGNIDRVFPTVGIVKGYGVVRVSIARNGETDTRGLIPFVFKQVAPVLGDRKRLDCAVLHGPQLGEGSFVLSWIFLARVNPRDFRFGVGFKVAIYVDAVLDGEGHVAPCTILAGVVFNVGHIVERSLAWIAVKCHGVDNAVKQRASIGEVPFDRTINKVSLRGLFVVKIVGFGPLILKVALATLPDYLSVYGKRVVAGPRHCLTVGADGIGDGITGNKVDALEGVIAFNRNPEPILIRGFVDLKKFHWSRADHHFVCGAVGNRNRRDAESLNDLLENILDGCIQSSCVGSVVIVRSVNGSTIHARTIGAILGIVNQVVEEVRLTAVCVDT